MATDIASTVPSAHPPMPPQGVLARTLRWLASVRAPAGFLLAVLAIYVGWTGRSGRDISAGEGLGYWLGIIGGTLMLLLLLYSVRKRVPLLKNLGPTRHWFRLHMSLGIIGPIIILYHSNFQVGSFNSQVALYCTLTVAASGVIGRYIYGHIHNGLYGNKASLRQLVAAVEDAQQRVGASIGISPEVKEQLAVLARQVLARPETLGKSALTSVLLGWKTRWMYWSMKRSAFGHIEELAATSPVVSAQQKRLRRATRFYLASRLGEIRKVAQFGFFERLFSLWHIVHVPFFLMMVLSAIVHVLAVHMY